VIFFQDKIKVPTHGGQLIALELDDPLPKATFYLIQRKDTALTPMSAYMAQLFRRYCQQR
jgi:LysR family transcriptional regulator, regulator of abg operon